MLKQPIGTTPVQLELVVFSYSWTESASWELLCEPLVMVLTEALYVILLGYI